MEKSKRITKMLMVCGATIALLAPIAASPLASNISPNFSITANASRRHHHKHHHHARKHSRRPSRAKLRREEKRARRIIHRREVRNFNKTKHDLARLFYRKARHAWTKPGRREYRRLARRYAHAKYSTARGQTLVRDGAIAHPSVGRHPYSDNF